MTPDTSPILSCPFPIQNYPHVLMAHGGGGRLMQDLIEKIFLKAFGREPGHVSHDGAICAVPQGKLAFTSDSYVVQPLFFPGGDIGSLAVNGTVNDLAMCGARPLALSTGFILEEGLAIETLWKIALSMRKAADAAGVRIVTGDTKVVERGKGDQVFINTSGIGMVPDGIEIGPRRIRSGDQILLSGDLGRHGMAIMSKREGLEFETEIHSDSAALHGPVSRLLDAGIEVHCLRDLTRGGLSAALNEFAAATNFRFEIEEEAVLVSPQVRAACEILGLDPLYVANEGRFVAVVEASAAQKALAILQSEPLCQNSRLIGKVTEGEPRVSMKTAFGTFRIVDWLSGEQLPRIC